MEWIIYTLVASLQMPLWSMDHVLMIGVGMILIISKDVVVFQVQNNQIQVPHV